MQEARSSSDADATGAGAGGVTSPGPAAGEVTVRDATRADMPLLHAMMHELAASEGWPQGPQFSVADLVEDGFDSSPAWFFALVAETRAEAVGYALCHRAYSSWSRRELYLEDLYVRSHARRLGVASALLARLCQMSVSVGARSVEWYVLESNAAARALYARVGARAAPLPRLAMRLDARAIAAAAAAAPPPPPPPPPEEEEED